MIALNPLNLPQAPLSFTGVSEAQQELLVAIYVGAFNRAPEFAGLQYWAGKLSTRLTNNEPQYDALQTIGREMYEAGASNGEGGTQVDTAEFVRLAYENSLGRSPVNAEISYWANEIESGKIDRGTFITNFLDEAFKNTGDSEFLQARVGVAEFLALEHVSGPGAPGNDVNLLRTALAAVKDEASAVTAINQINNQYGQAPDNSGGQHDSIGGVVDIHLLTPHDKNIVIDNFEANLDQFGMSPELKAIIGSLKYTGEPHNLSELQSPEYFTGVLGQAALLRDSNKLVIDLNGDGLYDPNTDLTVSLPGVFQLEDWNFLGSDSGNGNEQPGDTEQAAILPSTANVADTHILLAEHRNLLITDFEAELDKFSISPELKAMIGQLDYVGEPDNREELHSSEYFTGVAGQAAFLKDSKMLVIDLNGDGKHNHNDDITISMPGIWQLEDWNFIA